MIKYDDNHIPYAEEMIKRTQHLLSANINNVMAKITKSLNQATEFSTTVIIYEEEEKVIDEVIKQLQNLGYKVDFDASYFDDRPCGGRTHGKLNISWKP